MTRKHLILMTIGCALPVVGLAAIFLFQIPVGTVALVGLLLLCPALHLWMLRGHVGHTTTHQTDTRPLSDKRVMRGPSIKQ